MMGKIRNQGDLLLEGVSPIPGVTADKIANAIINGGAVIEVSPDKELATENETKNNHNGIGSMFTGRSRRNKKS